MQDNTMPLDLQRLREDYTRSELTEDNVAADPIRQFETWFEQATEARLPEPNAMVLATVNAAGRPAARVVLLKEVEDGAFVFYTNYHSDKGRELQQNPVAALVFNWLELQRQVRIEGRVEKLDPAQSTAYFQSRPKGSQIGAWASPQSRVIPDREVLEQKAEELQSAYAGQDKLPRPEHWGGFRLIPDRIEFWQGRSSRLHDRLNFRREGTAWKIERLAP